MSKSESGAGRLEIYHSGKAKNMLSDKRGITRGEILAIIVILAALAGAMIPVVRNSRQAGLKSACATNLCKIAVAIQAYSRDYSGKVPQAESTESSIDIKMSYITPQTSSSNASPGLWYNRLRSYIKPEYFICPATTPDMKDHYFYQPAKSKKAKESGLPYTTYGMNWRFFNGGALGGDPKHPKQMYAGLIQPLDSPPVPSRTVLLIETQQRMEWTGKAKSPFTSKPKEGGNVTPYGDWDEWFWAIRWLNGSVRPSGHIGGCNIILADGHSAFVDAPEPPYPPSVSYIETQGYKWW